MNPEQEPDLTDKSEIDPSINPNNLVVQEGEDMGRVNAFETERGTAILDNGEKKDIPDSEQPHTVEGLPVIGAEAEQASRNSNKAMSDEQVDRWNKIKESNPDANHKENTDQYHDEVGTEAMAAEVKKRAMALVPAEARDELREEYGELAATKFKDELKANQAERKVAQDAADTKTQEMIDKLKNVDTPLSEVIEIPETPETPTEDPGYIDTSVPETPEPGHF